MNLTVDVAIINNRERYQWFDIISNGLSSLGISADVRMNKIHTITFKSQDDLNLCLLSGMLQEFDNRVGEEKLFIDKIYRWIDPTYGDSWTYVK